MELVHHAVVTSLVKAHGQQRSRIQRAQTNQTGVAVHAHIGREDSRPVMDRVALAKRAHNRIQCGCRYHLAIVVKHHTRVAPGRAVRGVFYLIAQLHHVIPEEAVALHQVEVVSRTLGVVDHRVGTVVWFQLQQLIRKLVKKQVVGRIQKQTVAHRVHIILVAVRVVLVQLYIYLIHAALARRALQVEIQGVVVDAV